MAAATRGRATRPWERLGTEYSSCGNSRLGFAEIQRALQHDFEFHVFGERQILANSRGGHEGFGRSGCCTFSGVLLVVIDDSRFRASESGHGHRQGFLLMVAGGCFDFAFAVEEDVDGVNARGVDYAGDERNPAGAGVDVVESDPEVGPAGFSGGLDFIEVSANFSSEIG